MYISGNDASAQPHQRPVLRTRASRFARAAAPYLAAFAIPFCVLLAAFAMRGIYPFGDVSVMLYDMPVQYAEYFGWLIQVLHGQGNLLYSNAAGFGGGMFSLFTYYLSSPFNLIALFFTPETVPQLFSVLYLVKIPACAVCCLVLLRGRLLAADAESWREARTTAANAPAGRQVLLVLLACAYALTSYVLGYASNIMWLDGVIMAPLAALGAYRLVQRRACGGLFAACACAIVFNWYTGYMVCLLCVLWFFYELARNRSLRGRRLRRCWRFAATMALAVGAGMVVLIPTALALLGGKGTHAGLASLACNTGLARNPLAVADLFCIGTLPGITTQANLPALTISALVLVGVGMFLANGAVGRRERIAGTAFALVMATSLVFTPVATIWSGFVPESSYTNRNGFAILLVMTALAAEGLLALSRLDARPRRRCALIGGGAALVSVAGSAACQHMAKGSLPQAPELVALECGLLAAFTLLVAGAAGTRGAIAGPDGKGARDAEAEQIGGKTGNASPGARATRGKASPSPTQTDSLLHGQQSILRAALCVALTCAFVGEQVFSAQAQLSRCRYTVSGYTDTLTELETFYSQLEGATAGDGSVSGSEGDSGSDEGKVGNVSGVYSTATGDADGVSAFTRVGNAAPYWGGSKANGPDNMALVLGVSTFDHYSSTQEYRIQQLLHDLGYSKVTPFGTYYMSSNVIADALLGVTDIVDDQPPAATEPEGAVLRGTWRAYRNELALPLGWNHGERARRLARGAPARQPGRHARRRSRQRRQRALRRRCAGMRRRPGCAHVHADPFDRRPGVPVHADGVRERPVLRRRRRVRAAGRRLSRANHRRTRVVQPGVPGLGTCRAIHAGDHQAAGRAALRAALRGRHRDERAIRVLGCSRRRTGAGRHREPANPARSAVAHRFRRFCAHDIRERMDCGNVQRHPR